MKAEPPAALPPPVPLRFEGSVAVLAERTAVWAFLTDPNALGRITPGFLSADVLSPTQHHITHTLPFAQDDAVFSTTVEWLEVVAPERLALAAHTLMSQQPVTVTGAVDLRGTRSTDMVFSAEFVLPAAFRSAQRAFMRPLITRAITTFFKNLKNELE